MQKTVGTLEESVGEYFFETLVGRIARTKSVTVPNHTTKSIIVSYYWFSMNRDAELFFEVAKCPKVVVADMEMNRNSAICNFSDSAQQTNGPLRHGMSVFEPEVKKVADQMDFSS